VVATATIRLMISAVRFCSRLGVLKPVTASPIAVPRV